jgi:hypothetical protein
MVSLDQVYAWIMPWEDCVARIVLWRIVRACGVGGLLSRGRIGCDLMCAGHGGLKSLLRRKLLKGFPVASLEPKLLETEARDEGSYCFWDFQNFATFLLGVVLFRRVR